MWRSGLMALGTLSHFCQKVAKIKFVIRVTPRRVQCTRGEVEGSPTLPRSNLGRKIAFETFGSARCNCYRFLSFFLKRRDRNGVRAESSAERRSNAKQARQLLIQAQTASLPTLLSDRARQAGRHPWPAGLGGRSATVRYCGAASSQSSSPSAPPVRVASGMCCPRHGP